MKKLTLSLIVMTGLMLMMIGIVSATDLNVNQDYADERDVIVAAADRLVLLQGTYGSWDWVVTSATGPTGTIYLNIAGVTAQGLLTAYELTGNSVYLDSAIQTGDYLITEYGANAELATMFGGTKRINAFSIKFLYDLGSITNDGRYTTLANALMTKVIAHSSTGSALLDANLAFRGTTNGNGISMWDVYNYVENAETFGRSDWASELADAIEAYDLAVDDRTNIIGLAGKILATRNSGDVASLISVQATDGHFANILWSDEHIQPTAYAVMALMSVGEYESALKGQVFLSGQSSDGVWLDAGVEYAEVDSEALQAIFDYIYIPDTYYTIQDAIDAASAGDTINVAAGTYVESLTVDKEVSIIGAGNTVTIIQPLLDSDGITITANNVVIKDLKIVTSNSGSVPNIAIAIKETDGVEINNVVIETTGNKAMGIWVGGSSNGLSPSSDLTIVKSEITINNEATGIYAAHSDPAHSGWIIGGSSVNENTVTAELGLPIELYDVSDSEVSYNTLTTSASGGAALIWSSELVNIANLVFNYNTVNYSGGSQVAILSDFWVLGDGLDNTAVDSVIITGNTFSNWDSKALRIGSDVTNVLVNQNKFLRDSQTLTLLNEDASQVNAEYNWWGTAVESEILALISGDVDYDPWCLNDECTNIGGEGLDFVALTVPDFIDYGALYSTPGFETAAQEITLTNVGSLDVLVTPIWESGAEVFKHIKFSDDGTTYGMLSGGVGAEADYTKTITAIWVSGTTFLNAETVWTKIKIAAGLAKLVGPQTGTIYFQAVEA